MDKKVYREVIGERLKEFREDRGMTEEEVARVGGITVEKVMEIEDGNRNYSMDDFIGYIVGSDLYMYFAEKTENRERPHDFKDIADKGRENDPKK